MGNLFLDCKARYFGLNGRGGLGALECDGNVMEFFKVRFFRFLGESAELNIYKSEWHLVILPANCKIMELSGQLIIYNSSEMGNV